MLSKRHSESINNTMKKTFIISLISIFGGASVAQSINTPSFEEVISLQTSSNAAISPDGRHVVYEVQAADWKKNRYDRELWLSKNAEKPFQLTNNLNSSSNNPKWSPDGNWITFISKRGEKNQLHAIRLVGGEAFQITNTESNISSYEWSPDGKSIAFLQSEDNSETNKKREDKYGGFAVDDMEYSLTQLWMINFDPAELNSMPSPDQMQDSVFKASLAPKLLMDSVDFTINDFQWSPDGKKIAFEHQPTPLFNSFFHADISIYELSSKTHKVLVANRSYDGLECWSPDGESILYNSSIDDSTSNFYANDNYFRINVDGTGNRQLAQSFDENISRIQWTAEGIFGLAWQRTNRPLIKINAKTGVVSEVLTNPSRIWNFSFSTNGKKIAYTGSTDHTLPEIYKSDYQFKSPKQLTQSTKQTQQWSVADSEVISWKSEDGTMIEGVLHKPKNYDPKIKYPLLVIIHGGPTGVSTPNPVPSYVYPMVQWLNKGALILRPNYRGSAGYGEKFRSLNVENLGVGDAWDVLSGVQHLEDKGIIDGDKVGCMGWSQGGYISAFLTTNSKKFKAISVGAGISNWMTYYVNTDIHPFTRQYLKATPWSNKEIYEKTSPMTNINNAATPTLIQHGEFDKRVPTANAYELLQGLQDVGVESKLVIYKGFGHGISKPKERLAATWHNWQWFAKYIWQEDIELPNK
jgi:dipeptidyl aminopeptidase/acylaminoacyl peptidase